MVVVQSTLDADTAHATPPRIALAHDWLVGMRGGERVLDRLAAMFGPTDLYLMVHDVSRRYTPALDACTIHTSSLQRWPGAAGRLRRWYLPLYPRAVESLRIEPHFDLLISTSSAMIKAIRPPQRRGGNGRVPHICYCHCPARYLWSLTDEYASGGVMGRLRRAGLGLFGKRLRRCDRRTCDRVDVFLANSTHTARAIQTCYGREATVVHPPVDTGFFLPDAGEPRGEHYLVLSALEPYKRIDLAIAAANQLGAPLRLGGDGSHLNYLKRRAGPTITFLGPLDNEQTRHEYRTARALLFPGIEDFGLVPVEAMACGCPVIAFSRGGAEDWMTSDVGLTFDSQTSAALADAITQFETMHVDADACRRNALRFSVDRFDAAIRREVNLILESSIGLAAIVSQRGEQRGSG